MLGGHLYELVIVLVIALVIFGPKRLPELGSSLGKGIREFRKATNEMQDSLKTEPTEALPSERRPFAATTEYTAPTHTAEYVATPAATPTQSAPAHPAEYAATPVQSAPVHGESQAPRV